VVRRVLVALLALGAAAVVLDHVGAAGKLTLFPLAALALIPLAWLIGEAIEQAASYTGRESAAF
jgi:Ca2+/H+ antiporter